MSNQYNVNQIIYQEYFDRVDQVKAKNIRFAHYTSARVALSIIKNKEIWLNNVQYMNDYSEIKLGNWLLTNFYNNDSGKELRNLLEDISASCIQELEFNYNSILPKLGKTYAFCLTEHDTAEDEFGRLSMWRAYAPNNGVAIVFNSAMFLEDVLNTSAMSIPMFYFNDAEFKEAVENFTSRIAQAKDILRKEPSFHNYIFNKFLITALSLKHKGFQEEREWRILFNNAFTNPLKKEIVTEKIEDINGVPRLVKKLKFSDIQFLNKTFNMNDLINRIIIGPSDNAELLKEIFIKALNENGVLEADKKVICSNIPVRI